MVRLALAQIVTGHDVEHNLELVADYTARAAREGAELVVFPEATMRAFGHNLTSIAEPLDGPWAERVRAIAAQAQITVVAGMFTPAEPRDDAPQTQRVRNTLLVTGPGIEANYHKIHLYDAFDFTESDTVAAGSVPVVVPIADLPVGMTTCYDVRFPGLFVSLADAGATLIVLPASWGAGPGKLDQWEVLVRARALDSTCFVAACGQADPTSVGLPAHATAPTGIGHSMVVDPSGHVLRQLGPGPELLVCDLDPARVDQVRRSLPVLRNRRY